MPRFFVLHCYKALFFGLLSNPGSPKERKKMLLRDNFVKDAFSLGKI